MTAARAAKETAIRELKKLATECRDRAAFVATEWEKAEALNEAVRLEKIIARKESPPSSGEEPRPSQWGPKNHRGFRRILFDLFGI